MFEYLWSVLSSLNVTEIGKFMLVGGSSAALYYTLFLFFNKILRRHYQIAATFAFIPAFFVNFYLQKTWTFAFACAANWHEQLLQFSAKKLLFYFLNMGFLYLLVECFGFRPAIAQAMLVPGLGIPGFLIVKWIFAC